MKPPSILSLHICLCFRFIPIQQTINVPGPIVQQQSSLLCYVLQDVQGTEINKVWDESVVTHVHGLRFLIFDFLEDEDIFSACRILGICFKSCNMIPALQKSKTIFKTMLLMLVFGRTS